jgi:CheY-like chemotaxis protein
MKTLVVDDHPGCRMMIQEILKRMGHHTDSAENGRDAVIMYVKAAENGEPYEFVSMDNEMPIMNGLQAFEMIRAFEVEHSQITRSSKICFVSSDDLCCCKIKKTDSNTDFIAKPLDIIKFIELVSSTANSSLPAGQSISNYLKKAA